MIQRSIWNQELVLLEKLLLSLQWQEESFQILKIEDKEENFSFMGKENHNSAGL